MAAGVAVHAREAVGEHAALEIGAYLALDEARDGRPRRSGALEEGLEVLAHDAVEERLLGLVTFVFDVGGARETGTEATPIRKPCARGGRAVCGGTTLRTIQR